MNAENKEQLDLDKLYSQITIAGDSQITLTKEQLDEYIKTKIAEELSDINAKVEMQNRKYEELQEEVSQVSGQVQNLSFISREEYEAIKSKVKGIKSGTVTLGKIQSGSAASAQITFNESLKDTNYAVVITNVNGGMHYAFVKYASYNKTVNGFMLSGYNTYSAETNSMSVDYIVIPYAN